MSSQQYGALDRFKVLAALLVVAIHTGPLTSVTAEGDFLLTHILARVAVPFFFLVTGYFLLPQYLWDRSMDVRPMRHFLGKVTVLYVGISLLYLPANFYAGKLQDLSAGALVRAILLNGTFYHLWYLPGVLLGVLLLWGLGKRCSWKVLAGIALGLYLVGLLGDSWYGLVTGTPLEAVYERLFSIASYTRNGLFFAPVFLLLGAWMKKEPKRPVTGWDGLGLVLALMLLVAEGELLPLGGGSRHDSMYLSLLPVLYFLFRLLLAVPCPSSKFLRETAAWIYFLHPMGILVVRGAGKVTGLEAWLVENSVLHYLAVCGVSVLGAAVIAGLMLRRTLREQLGGSRAWIELDTGALGQNVKALTSLLPEGCQLMPAVKANGYGHGAVPVSRFLQAHGVRAFCVATAQEGVELRNNGITGELLVLGYTAPEDYPLLTRYRLTQTVVDLPFARRLDSYGKPIAVHVAVDTGMHRLGIRWEDTAQVLEVFRLKHLKVTGLFTHLCVSDWDTEEGRAYTRMQGQTMKALCDRVAQAGYSEVKVHMAASYGLLHYPEFCEDYARAGIALYGVLSSRTDLERCPVPLAPVLSLKARVVTVRTLQPGERAGYGLHYEAREEEQIAVLAIGYADGVPRALSWGVGEVLLCGHRAPIVGNICMDQMLVQVTGIPGVVQGSEAVLLGRSGTLELTVYDWAEQTHTITNEVLSRLGSRLERRVQERRGMGPTAHSKRRTQRTQKTLQQL